jgi:hypothetical protein
MNMELSGRTVFSQALFDEYGAFWENRVLPGPLLYASYTNNSN